MKTRLLIIIGIIATLMITSFVLYNSIPMDDASRIIDLSKDETLLELYKDLPEVVAFYAEYENAQVSVREDHVSYFAGSEDNYLLRMNLEFDENYDIQNMEFHCYYQKTHQWEMPQEDIVSRLVMYDCGKIKQIENEN